jgi:hypothetical protein
MRQKSIKRMLKHEVGILFLHHNVDLVTLNNLESFRKHSPGVPIETMSSGKALANGHSILHFPAYKQRWQSHISKTGLIRSSGDLLLYSWYPHRKNDCARWLIAEWDCYCGVSINRFVDCVEDYQFVASSTRFPNREPEWLWFSRLGSLQPEIIPFACGVVPMAFTILDDRLLDEICRQISWSHLGNCNAELRLATLANSLGCEPVAHPLAGPRITWKPLAPHSVLGDAMYHPVKWIYI